VTEEKANIFGTDGIRDLGGHGWLAPDKLQRLSRAIVAWGRRCGFESPTVLIGRDPRDSGPEIEQILARALIHYGAGVIDGGMLPTPAVSVLVSAGSADLGIVISASHNPPEFNGLKFFSPDGAKLTVAEEERITADAFAAESPDLDLESSAAVESHSDVETALRERYLAELLSSFGEANFLEGLHVVLDSSRGATSLLAAEAFRRAGAEVEAIFCDPDGSQINVQCGSTHPEACAGVVLARRADLGIAFDGDGDRAILIDELGSTVDGDEMLALWALDLLAQGRLPGHRIAVTVMSNSGMESFLEEHGVELVRTKVGDRAVHQAMLDQGLALGGEQSGHLICSDAATGDGIRTGLQLARLVRNSRQPLSQLRAPIPRFPQTLIGIPVGAKPNLDSIPEICAIVEDAERALEGHGRVLLRYSGTEPLARVLVEGRDAEENRQWADRISEVIREHPALATSSLT